MSETVNWHNDNFIASFLQSMAVNIFKLLNI